MAIKGNKGEWSEIYALIKLLGDTKIYSGDGSLNRIEGLMYPILSIIRLENHTQYKYNIINNQSITIEADGVEALQIPTSELQKQASALLKEIKNAKGSSFAIPETEIFMDSINCWTLKAQSLDKTDIHIIIHDLRTGSTPQLGFSIKSKLGNPSTLLNPGAATNYIYSIKGVRLTEQQIEKINAIDSKSKVIDRIAAIRELGGSLEFLCMESSVFENNLILIDSSMPEITANMLKLHYQAKGSMIKDMILQLQSNNPLQYDISNSHKYYEYKIKKLLTDVALGMTPSKVWNGHYQANGGYLVVKEDGDVLCYHIYNKNDFENYLINNTKIETPSTSRYGFGVIETRENVQIFKLNMQIRFI